MNKKKMIAYASLPVLGLSLLGAGTASAHGMFGGFGSRTPEEIATAQKTMFEEQSKLLGVSVDELKEGWAEGKSLKDIATAKGITDEQLQAKFKEVKIQKMKSNLQALVDKGVITQAQADKRSQVMQTRLESAKGRMGKGMHHGMRF